MQHYRMASAVENDNGHRPVVFRSLCLGGSHHLFGRVETDRGAVRRCRGRRGSSGLLGATGEGAADDDYCRQNERLEAVHGASSSWLTFSSAPTQNNRIVSSA